MTRLLSIKVYFLTVLITLSVCTVHAQKRRNDLEREKVENQKKIEETNKILDETRSKKTTTIGQLNVIGQQIKEKNMVINTYVKEIRLLDDEIRMIEVSINSLKLHLSSLKREYAVMIYTASKANDSYNKLLFIFSSKDFNQLVMRLKYFQYYSQARHKQAEQIKKVAVSLRKQRMRMYAKRNEKTEILGSIRAENTSLKNLKGEQETTVKQLSEKEEQLMEEIEDRKTAVKKLEKLITDLIKREMEKAAANAEIDKKNKRTPEFNKISGDFLSNRSKLIWPVEHGFISGHFGKHPHQVFQHVEVLNLGVDIQTNRNERVRSVFEGIVTAVAEVPGMNNVVMIQHGTYYTFYAKLKSVSVKSGQKVKAKEAIGEVYTNDDEISELQFQIWKGNEKQDPESWLYNR
jgi:septal ring factor EnvC (AmiA/AmiB activator)